MRHAVQSGGSCRRQPTTCYGGKGGGIGSLARGVLSIITKSCPDDHLRIETDAPGAPNR
jgi:hypothetical protein